MHERFRELAEGVFLVGCGGWGGQAEHFSRFGDCNVYLIDGGGELALVDTGDGPTNEAILENVAAAGFEPARITAILLTHAHSDHAAAAGWMREQTGARIFAGPLAARALAEADRNITGPLEPFALFTPHPVKPDAIVVAVEQAYRKRIAAKASVGRGREENVAFNRRFRMRNGLTWTHPNGFRAYKNPDILEVAGPIDPEVGVIGVWDERDHFLGCVVNFASHCTNGVPGPSADYVYFLEKTIRSVMGEEAVVVFLNGACGDITQVNNLSPDNTEFGVRSARFVGTSIAAEALKVLTKAEPGHLLPLKARIKNLTIPRRRPSPEPTRAWRA